MRQNFAKFIIYLPSKSINFFENIQMVGEQENGKPSIELICIGEMVMAGTEGKGI